MSFFDVGTGTGILSIAVSKIRSTGYRVLGTEKDESEISSPRNPGLSTQHSVLSTPISGCDIDEDSVKIAIENARLNETDGIDFFIGSISEGSPEFDFICANVTADIILPMLPLLVEKSKKILLLSGILIEQKDLIVNKLKDLGVENAEIETDGEWVSLRVGFN
jgi:ribosomal protein L11 methylase PrmA